MTATILIAEDEPLTRLDLAETLQEAGYATIEASSADEAWEMLLRDQDVGCLFTDIQMPGKLDGLQLAEAVRARWPYKLIVIGSGKLRPVKAPVGAVFLPKPYNPARVTRVLGELHRQTKS